MGCKAEIPNLGESTQDMLTAYTRNYPDLVRVVSEQLLPYGQAQVDAQRVLGPQTQELNLDLLGEYLPRYSDIGADIMRRQQLANVESDAAALQRAQETGLVERAQELERIADPEFYASRPIIGAGINNLIGAMDPTRLSPAEEEQLTRGYNRVFGTGPTNFSNAAMGSNVFGTALQNKQANFANALTQATSALQGLRSGFSPYTAATGKNASTNPAIGNYQGPNYQQGNETLGMANNLLGNMTQLQLQRNQNTFAEGSQLDRVNRGIQGTVGSIGSIASLVGGIRRMAGV